MKTRHLIVVAACAAATFAGPAAGAAQAFGSLNTSFAGTGYATTKAQLLGIATNASGDIYAAGQSGGDVYVEELSESGQVLGSYTGGAGVARAVTVAPNGDIVLAGTTGSAMLVEELSGSLTPISGFGSGGVATAEGSQSGVANAVAIAPSGAIVVGGSVSPPNTQASVVEFNSNGSLNSGFGSGGVVTNSYGGYAVINGVVVEPTGQIVFVGNRTPSQVTDAIIGELTSSGGGDGSFAGGVETYDYAPPGGSSGYTAFTSVALQGDGKVVVGGTSFGGPYALLLRYDTNGSLDSGYGTGGVTAFSAAENVSSPTEPAGAYGVGIAGGGDVVGAGQYQNTPAAEDGALWATTANGTPDGNFGTSGATTAPMFTSSASFDACAIAVEPDGTIVTAGYEPTQAANDKPCQTGEGSTGFVASYSGNGPAPTGGAPVATTGGAGGVSTSGATVTGAVDPDGLATTYSFQYGTSTSYGSQSGPQNVGSGRSAVAASASLGSLTADTTYHYRLVASNADGITYGVDESFTTTAAAAGTSAPKVTTGGARAGETAATVTGAVGAGSLKTTYLVQYGTSSKYGAKTASFKLSSTGSSSVRAVLRGLKAHTTYHYRIVATNADGTTYGTDRTLRTVPLLKSTLQNAFNVTLKNGTMTVRVSCSAACSISGALIVSRRIARQYRIGRSVTTIARGDASLRHDGSVTVKLTLTTAAARAIARQQVVALLQVVVRPAASGPDTTYRRAVQVTD